ncbi:RNA ligase and tail fiber protein attachment catalyst [Streptomyces phage BRock]|uniref:RNA ligase n=1 Tax=Streptomyces phage BRock TaxID=1913591 RepID=A0A1J0GW81_9CAUD|nr:RNA ligase and tail fiber protein attachment catalyst [Streptomyces phage BRock]APC46427.1 RNA ligase [Streptomyces phage BRock]
MKIHELMDPWALQIMLEEGYVRYKTHNEFPELRIFEYTEKCVYERVWNNVTKKTRGLIVNWETKEILARPFDKFFNYGEPSQTVQLDPTDYVRVTDKMDGSLGILYRRPDGFLAIATKGSFHSEQAEWATKEIRKYMTTHFREDEETWMFEIIYPSNRIVLDYEGYSGLVLLGVRLIDEGFVALPEDVFDWKGRKATTFRYQTLQEALEASPRRNAEGFVVHIPDRKVMVKIKQEDYVLLHKIVTGLTPRRVWENLSEGKTLEDMLEIVPDEWHDWLREQYDVLLEKHWNICDASEKEYWRIVTALDTKFGRDNWSQKDFAEFAKDPKWSMYPHLVFGYRNGRDMEEAIWKMLKPRGDE